MSDSIAVYPGSFDPPTFGHLDLIERAAHVFTSLIVAVARNSEKNSLFTPDERVEMLREITTHLDNVTVEQFKGLTIDLARKRKAAVLIRGIRTMSDFEYELTMAATNRKMYAGCDTISFMPTEPYMFISSRLVKEIAQFAGDVTQFVPTHVVDQLKIKLAKG